MQTSAEPTGGMRLREFGDGGEELDENDLWDTMDGHDADDVSATSDDDDEGVALEAVERSLIEQALERIADGEPVFLVNTHWHGDHTGGNPHFGRTATILAHANVRRRLAGDPSIGGNVSTEELPAIALPEITFDEGTIYVDGDVVGSYVEGDELDSEWRALLGGAMALENGALAEMLADWRAPSELASEHADAALGHQRRQAR